MFKGKRVITAVAISTSCFANDLQQQYEKAYYLETAKGKLREAAAVYQSIADIEATDENREAIQKSLLRLLLIGTARNHETTIKDCHEKLLAKTDTSIQDLVDLTPER